MGARFAENGFFYIYATRQPAATGGLAGLV
jgi:hypothetical protein